MMVGSKSLKGMMNAPFHWSFFANMNVVESPLDIKLGKNRGVFHVVDQFRDKG